mgnify:CR=1 FL=1
MTNIYIYQYDHSSSEKQKIYDVINAINANPTWKAEFDKLRNREKTLHFADGYPYFVDYNSPEVDKFLMTYRALYNTEPTQYAFQGYDIATYFISMCSRYGSDWMRKLDGSEQHMLQSTFRFVQTENGGYVNQGIRRVVYGDNWSVIKTR